MNFEQVLLSHLVFNEEYARKVIPFVKPEYFSDSTDRIIFNLIDNYVKEYNSFPTKEALVIDLGKKDGISDEQFKLASDMVQSFEEKSNKDMEWLLDTTEKFCQDKAIYNAIMTSINILDDKTGKLSKGAIPQILNEALGVSFDTAIGHDFLDDTDSRYEFYHRKERKIPFDLDMFNKITKGGLPTKTLNIALAGTGVGKSLFMCHCAAGNLVAGLNVLYITMEMAEERIAERIDANLLNVPLDELEILPKEAYDKKIQKIGQKNIGKLIIKEYPTGAAHVGHFRALLNELKLKKNFKPDIIFVDYLNICASALVRDWETDRKSVV